MLPAWLVVAAVGTLAAYIDIRTQFLPTALLGPAYAAVAVLLVGAALLGGERDRLLIALYSGLLPGAVVGTALIAAGMTDRRYPFGPFLLAGAVLGLLWSRFA